MLEQNSAYLFLFMLLLAIAILSIAKHYNYFTLPDKKRSSFIKFDFVFLFFFAYIITYFIISHFLIILLDKTIFFYLINLICHLILLFNFGIICFFMKKNQLKNIWKESFVKNTPTYFDDIKIALISFLIAAPLILLTSNLLEIITNLIFHVKEMPNQIAIEYIKSAYDNPLDFSIALFIVIILAPLTEEFLFRGVLQTFIKRFCSIKTSIYTTSLAFAFFHFHPAQLYNNIVIIGSLFVFSNFLGFIYERQKSLISSIALHSIFNTVSVFNLLVFNT
jgi:membrane protease YdiL (CAAX protease family)